MYLPFQLLHSIIGLRKLVLYNYHKQPKQKVYLQRALFIILFDNQTRIFVTGHIEYKLLKLAWIECIIYENSQISDFSLFILKVSFSSGL